MSSNPKINLESIMPAKSFPKSVSVTVDSNGCTPSSKSVATGGDVTLTSKTGSNVLVYTHMGGSLTAIFNEGVPPYSATTGGGTRYTLKASITGAVSFDLEDPAAAPLGGNGTINVGG